MQPFSQAATTHHKRKSIESNGYCPVEIKGRRVPLIIAELHCIFKNVQSQTSAHRWKIMSPARGPGVY